MATKGIEPAKKPEKNLSKKERQELRKRLEEISKISNEEQLTRKQREQIRQAIAKGTQVSYEDIIEALRQQPRSMLSVTVLVDSLWPKFLKEINAPEPPVRGEKECDIDFNERVRVYNTAMSTMRKIAPFWYFCGLTHDENITQLLVVLDTTKDADAPDDSQDK